MHPRALAERNAAAHERITRAASELATVFGLHDEVRALFSIKNREPQVQRLHENEAMADLLEAICNALIVETGAKKEAPGAPNVPAEGAEAAAAPDAPADESAQAPDVTEEAPPAEGAEAATVPDAPASEVKDESDAPSRRGRADQAGGKVADKRRPGRDDRKRK